MVLSRDEIRRLFLNDAIKNKEQSRQYFDQALKMRDRSTGLEKIVNAAAAAIPAYITSGGNPLVAAMSAVQGATADNPLEAGVKGFGQGTTSKFLADPAASGTQSSLVNIGADGVASPDVVGQTFANAGNVANIGKTAQVLWSFGAPESVTKPMEKIGEYNTKEAKQKVDNAKSNYELNIADLINKKDMEGLEKLKQTINSDTSLSLIDKNTLIKSILKADTDVSKTPTTPTKKPSGSNNEKAIISGYEVEALRADSLDVLIDIINRIDKDKSLSDAGRNEATKKVIAQEKKIESNIKKIKEQFKKEQADNMIEDSELIPGAIDDYLERVKKGETPSIKDYVVVKEPEKKKRWFSKKDKKPSIEDLRKQYNY